MYTLDTNVIIYYVNEDAEVVRTLEELYAKNTPVYVSVMTEIELFSFSELQSAEADAIESFLRTTSIIPIDSRLARLAGAVRRTYGLRVADSVVAATALFTSTAVLTRNVRDFKKVTGLQVVGV